MNGRRYAAHAVSLVVTIMLAGCLRPFIHKPKPGEPVPETGRPVAIFVIDTSQSVWAQKDLLFDAVRSAVEQYRIRRDTDLVFIRLDAYPEEIESYPRAEMNDAAWSDFVTKVSRLSEAGEGTDQVGAMERVLDACDRKKNVVPEWVALLYFSDMLMEQPKNDPRRFRTWEQFNWQRVRDRKMVCQFYVFSIPPRLNPAGAELQRETWRSLSQRMEAAKVRFTQMTDSELRGLIKLDRPIPLPQNPEY